MVKRGAILGNTFFEPYGERNHLCTPRRTRTFDPRIKNPLLYQLSYWRIPL
jgi:hypothetical protein